MAKYLVETYYTSTFKVTHYLDDINEAELKNLEKRDDGKFEVLEVKLDNRKTKSLVSNNDKVNHSKTVDLASSQNKDKSKSVEKIITQSEFLQKMGIFLTLSWTSPFKFLDGVALFLKLPQKPAHGSRNQ